MFLSNNLFSIQNFISVFLQNIMVVVVVVVVVVVAAAAVTMIIIIMCTIL